MLRNSLMRPSTRNTPLSSSLNSPRSPSQKTSQFLSHQATLSSLTTRSTTSERSLTSSSPSPKPTPFKPSSSYLRQRVALLLLQLPSSQSSSVSSAWVVPPLLKRSRRLPETQRPLQVMPRTRLQRLSLQVPIPPRMRSTSALPEALALKPRGVEVEGQANYEVRLRRML